MKFLAGETNVPAAATRVALSTDASIGATDRLLWARFKGKPGNTGDVYVGDVTVAAAQGWTLVKTDSVGFELPIRTLIGHGGKPGSIPAGSIYFDAATNGDDVQWAVLIED